jgi:hypothetical protein
MFAAGALAALVSAALPPSMARAQVAAIRDPAAAQIQCSLTVEENALRCKEVDLKTLQECLDQASQANTTDAVAAAQRECDKIATATLTKCQFNGTVGDLRCRINPNSNPVGITAE